jgi:hypothetical protein
MEQANNNTITARMLLVGVNMMLDCMDEEKEKSKSGE